MCICFPAALANSLQFKAGQQVVLLEGVESMAKIPAEVKDRIHAEFMPPLSYGPLD